MSCKKPKGPMELPYRPWQVYDGNEQVRLINERFRSIGTDLNNLYDCANGAGGGGVSPGIQVATFIFGRGQGTAYPISDGDDTNRPMIPPIAAGLTHGAPYLWHLNAEVAPLVQDAVFDILLNDESIFDTSHLPTIPVGSTDLQSGTVFNFSGRRFQVGDFLKGLVISRGGDLYLEQAQSVTLQLYWPEELSS